MGKRWSLFLSLCLLVLSSAPVLAEPVAKGTLGRPGDRGIHHGLKQYRHLSLGKNWAKMVVPAKNNDGKYVCTEVKTKAGVRILTRYAEVMLRDGGKLTKTAITRFPRNGRTEHRSEEILNTKNGQRIKLSSGARLSLKPLDHLGLYRYEHLRYVFDAGDSALRYDQPLLQQAANQLGASL